MFWRLSLSPSSGVYVMSVVFTRCICTQSFLLPSPDHMGNSRWSQVIVDVVSQSRPCGEHHLVI
jgi:hypothetical protein